MNTFGKLLGLMALAIVFVMVTSVVVMANNIWQHDVLPGLRGTTWSEQIGFFFFELLAVFFLSALFVGTIFQLIIGALGNLVYISSSAPLGKAGGVITSGYGLVGLVGLVLTVVVMVFGFFLVEFLIQWFILALYILFLMFLIVSYITNKFIQTIRSM